MSADHVCRVIEIFIGSLYSVQLGFSKAQPAATGHPAYDPADLLKLSMYGYVQLVRSSLRLERELPAQHRVDVAAKPVGPDHKTIAEFRRR